MNFLFQIVILIISSQIVFTQTDSLFVAKTSDFEISGKGDNPNWQKTEWVQLLAKDAQNEKRLTSSKILYSETGIYFLFYCEDKTITSTCTADYSDLYEEDVIEIFLWTSEDYPFYFEYELSPHNYELPIFVPNVEGDFFGWKPWHYEGDRKTRHATFIENSKDGVKGWSGEFFIPYALLKPMANVPPNTGTTWRANMYRIDYDKGPSAWTWQPVTTNFHEYMSFGSFVFE
tara:strand:- start:8088 stop:8780 length:693 start_codon:yes stop_codon:yes gene_type:complete